MAGSARPNLGVISGWSAGEDGWDTGMEQNLRRLDSLVMLSVKDKDLNTPPGAPADGDRYIVGPSPTGAWASKAGQVAVWESGPAAWTFYVPKKGWVALVEDEGGRYRYESSWVTHQAFNNVLDFSSVAAAIAATPAGGRLYFPSAGGPYTPPDANGWTIDKPIEIFSDGPGIGEALGFKYFNSAGAGNGNSVVFNLTKNAKWFHLHDTVISNNVGTPAAGGTGDAIRFDDATGVLLRVQIERVEILYAGRSAVRFTGANYVLATTMRDVRVYGCRGPGVYIYGCNVVTLDSVYSSQNKGNHASSPSNIGGSCFYLQNCAEVSMRDCVSENAGQDLANTTYDCYTYFANCHNGSIMGLHVEDAGEAAVKNGIVLNSCKGIVVGGNGVSFPAAAGSRGIYLVGNTRGCTVLSNEFNFVEKAVEIDATAADYGNIVLPQFVNNANATAPGRIILPADSKNFAFVTNQVAGVADNKGVGLVLPKVTDTVAATYVMQNQLMWTDGTNVFIRLGGVTKTFTITG